MSSLVSVIIPTWNRSILLTRSIKSALSQTYKNIEVIVCDDGSDDGTQSTVREMMLSNSRIKYFRINHTGHPSIVRNLGIAHSKGEWIAFLDSDDYWVKTKIETQINMAGKRNANFICSNAYLNENKKSAYFSTPEALYSLRNILPNNPIITSSVIVKNSIFQDVGTFNESKRYVNSQDYEMWLRIILFHQCLYLDERLVHYRSLSHDSHSNLNIKPTRNIFRILIFNGFWQIRNSIYTLNNPIIYVCKSCFLRVIKLFAATIKKSFRKLSAK